MNNIDNQLDTTISAY